MKLRPSLLSLLFIFLSCTCVRAQIPSLSPAGKLEQVVGNTSLTVSYERPSARGRKIFGGLVPYYKVWRTGAGYCTKICFDRDLMFGRQTVVAGTYSLLTVPGPEEWTIILNADTKLYGSKDYDREKDVIRFRVPSQNSSRFYEALTIDIDVIPDNAQMYISWANTQVSFSITTSTAAEVSAYLTALLNEPLSDTANYAWAAEHLLLQRRELNTALQLTERQLRAKESEYPWRIRMEIFEYLGHPDRALDAAESALAFRKANPLDANNQAWSIDFWMEEIGRLRRTLRGG